MKLRSYIFQIANDSAHDRNLDALLDRANRLGLHMERAIMGTGLASGTALLFVGVIAEAGETFNPDINRGNFRLRYLRESFDPITVKVEIPKLTDLP